MKNKNKIAFFKTGPFSHTNDSIYKLLQSSFSNYTIEVVDIWEEGLVNIKSIKNIYFSFLEYGFSIFKSKKHLIKALVSNTFIFNLVKEEINKKYNKNDFIFTFQTQSLYDMSIKEVPNFMYTDHTFLVNESYPGFTGHLLYSEKYIECEKSIYENATINFTMSNHVTYSIINDYQIDPKKVSCVYAGPNSIIENVDKISDARYGAKNILFVGVNWERKGGPTLVKAFEKILKTHPDANLTIVGCNPEIDVKNCNIVGKIPVTDVSKYYEKASIFCLPTTLEPFGMVFVEAMTYKLPIVSTRIGALPDFVEDGINGFLVEPEDSDTLAEKLTTLLNSSSQCKSFGEYSVHIVKNKYTWENVGKKIKNSILESINLK